jgi:probable F420-dependent oxidoreductase
VRVGVHLPQYGRAAGPDAIQRAAVHAEQLGFTDLWVSDHIVHPAAQDYPSPYLYDPLLTLAWAGAVTERIGLGTSVLVAAQHNPVALANALASLDALSKGRLTIAIGVGWSAAEFAALGQSFSDRGRRTDEIIELLRACWRDDPVDFAGEYTRLDAIRVLPKPARHPDLDRRVERGRVRPGVQVGQGFQLLGMDPEQVRADRPPPARPAWSRLHDLAAHGLGSPGHGPRPHPPQHEQCARPASSTWCRPRGATTSTPGCARWSSSPA